VGVRSLHEEQATLTLGDALSSGFVGSGWVVPVGGVWAKPTCTISRRAAQLPINPP
jgi:hypothetical protein